ncbi:acyl-CoA dehydrogenase family protein [Phytohabitans kaempferiae]|uniref:Acyl-CoA dehydrogenase family protein n=1 Tax=Phytohabitans kaempferiae TaxID=1620943 RepID=A0ABV6MFQ2_9ACTN
MPSPSGAERGVPPTDARARFLAAESLGDLRRAVRDWLEAELPAAWVAAVHAGEQERLRAARAGLDEARWWAAMAACGLAVPTWPVAYGGLGMGAEQAGTIGAALRDYKTPRSRNPIGLNMVAPALLRWGSEEQRHRYLPGIASQQQIWCQLFSEPGAGSDLASLATRAERRGDGWVVSGQKVWTSLGHLASMGLLLARTDPEVPKHAGISVFCVPMSSPGVTVRPLRQITGDAEFNEVFLDEVEVPDGDRLGGLGEGWSIARRVLAHERVSDSGAGVLPGVIAGRSVAELIRRYGESVDPQSRHRLARAWIDEEALRLTIERSRQARAGDGTARVDGAVTKMLRTAHSQALQDLALDLDGTDAVAWADDDRWRANTAWSYLRVQARSIAGGTSQITRNVIGERVLGLPREPSADRDVPWNRVRRSGP